MECVILWRNTSNGRVGFLSDENGEISVFENWDEAVDVAADHPICVAFPFQIVELDEL